MITYFDTSAIVKLLIDEPGSDLVEHLWLASDGRVCVTVGRVQAVAALARAGRDGRLTARAVRRSVTDLTSLWASLYRVTVDDSLAADAADLALAHGLRGYDAVHLAAAAASADSFVAADQRLLSAARAVGLATADVAG